VPDQFIVGIDVGSSKLCSAIAIREMSGTIRYVGHGSAPSSGYRGGEVTDVEQLAAAFGRAIEEARYLIGAPVHDVALCVSGARLEALDRSGGINLEPGRPVDQSDILRAIGVSRGSDPAGLHTVHRVVRALSVDGAITRDPTGRIGRRLEVATRDLAMPAQLVERLRQAAEAAGVQVHTLIPEGVAAATAATTEEERSAGVAVVDIGSGGADLAVYVDGELRHVAAVPLGGNHITADIAGVIDISTEQAESLKRQYGAIDRNSNDELMEWNARTIAALQRQAATGDIPPGAVRSIAAARAIQIVDALHTSLRDAGMIDYLRAGVILTGGTSQLRGIEDIANAIIGVPVRSGAVVSGDGFPSIVDPSAVPSVGLVRYCALRANAAPAARGESRRIGAGVNAFVHPAVQRVMPVRDTMEPPPSKQRAERTGTRSWGRAFRNWMREFVPARVEDQ
jgi:cell division protein FtsA